MGAEKKPRRRASLRGKVGDEMPAEAVLGAVADLENAAIRPDSQGRVSFPVHPASPLAAMVREAEQDDERRLKAKAAREAMGEVVEGLECRVGEIAQQVVGVSTEQHRERLFLDWERRALHGCDAELEARARIATTPGGSTLVLPAGTSLRDATAAETAAIDREREAHRLLDAEDFGGAAKAIDEVAAVMGEGYVVGLRSTLHFLEAPVYQPLPWKRLAAKMRRLWLQALNVNAALDARVSALSGERPAERLGRDVADALDRQLASPVFPAGGQLGSTEDRSSAPEREPTPGELVGRWLDAQLGYPLPSEERAPADRLSLFARGTWFALSLDEDGDLSEDVNTDTFESLLGGGTFDQDVTPRHLLLRLPGGSLKEDRDSLATEEEVSARDERKAEQEADQRRADEQRRLYEQAMAEKDSRGLSTDPDARIHVFTWSPSFSASLRDPTSPERGNEAVSARCGAITRAPSGCINWVTPHPGDPRFCEGCKAALEADKSKGVSALDLGLRSAAALLSPSQVEAVGPVLELPPLAPAGRSRRRSRR